MNQVQSAKDMGVTIDKTLNFSTHIDTIVADANRLVGLLRRSLIAMDNKCFLTLFKTLIRPKLEYNNSVWCPSTKKDLTKLEAVQRRATKMLPGMSQLSYPERLKALDLPTVIYRRLRGNLIQVFKYLQGYYDVNRSNLFHINEEPAYCTRGHEFKLSKTFHSSVLKQNFFAVRVINNCNALPEETVCSSLNEFRNNLDRHWDNNPVKFDPNQ